MNGSNEQPLLSSQQPNIMFHAPVPISQHPGIGNLQMWSDSTSLSAAQLTDSSGRLLQMQHQAIIMANVSGGNGEYIRTPLTISSLQGASNSGGQLIFATPQSQETILANSPISQMTTNQLNLHSNGSPLTSFVRENLSPSSSQQTANSYFISSSPHGSSVFSSQSASMLSDQHVQIQNLPIISNVTQIAPAQSTTTILPSDFHCFPLNNPDISSETNKAQAPRPESQVSNTTSSSVFSSKSLADLIKETDPDLQLDDETEEALMMLSEEFVEFVAEKAARLAMHRSSSTVEAKDIKFALERDWNIFVPGFSANEKIWKRPFVLQAHNQRMAVLKKQIKRA